MKLEQEMNRLFAQGARQRTLKSALLGAVAVAALGAAALEATPFAPSAAIAAATQPSAGPASFADIVDKVKSSVVSVKVKIAADDTDADSGAERTPNLPPGTPFDRFFRQFGFPPDQFDDIPMPRNMPHPSTTAQGSGFFISADGYIVTNNHVVDHAKEVTVTTADGKTISAKVVGTDPKTDLALLKTNEGGNYPYVGFANDTPRVGDWVIAVGNPFGLGGTVTAGIVSARGRDIGNGPYDDFLQIDAPINHGNSGGPAFNTDGEVVGVTTAIFSPSGGSVGIGFAIESSVVKSVVDQLKENGVVARGWLGVEIQPVTSDLAESLGVKDTNGALVAKEQPNSPAAAAGVKTGDIIVSVNGDQVADPKDLARRIASLGPKKTVELGIYRGGAMEKINVMLGTMPNDAAAAFDTPSSRPDQSGQSSSLSKYGLTLERERGQEGVRIASVDPSSLAADKGLKPGDVILEAAGKTVSSPAEIADALDTAKAEGRKVLLLRVKSGDSVRFLTLPTQAPA